MFSEPYKGVAYFGHWAEGPAEVLGRRDALAILADAVGRCGDQDMRTADVKAALEYLKRSATRQGPLDHFRRSLDLVDPENRMQSVTVAYEAIRRLVSASIVS